MLYTIALIAYIFCMILINTDYVNEKGDGAMIIVPIVAGIVLGGIVFYPLMGKGMDGPTQGFLGGLTGSVVGAIGSLIVAWLKNLCGNIAYSLEQARIERDERLAQKENQQIEATVAEKTPYEKCALQIVKLNAMAFHQDQDVKDRISKFCHTATKAIEVLDRIGKTSLLNKLHDSYIQSVVAAFDTAKEIGTLDKSALLYTVNYVEVMLNGFIVSETTMKQMHVAANLTSMARETEMDVAPLAPVGVKLQRQGEKNG